MGGASMKKATCALLAVAVVAGCSSSGQVQRKNPRQLDRVQVCRAYLSSTDAAYSQQLAQELANRRVDPATCGAMVEKQQRAVAAGLAIAAIGMGALACSKYGCGSPSAGPYADWDQFYNQHYQLVWMCREVRTGRFTYDNHCAGRPQTDFRWPSKSAQI